MLISDSLRTSEICLCIHGLYSSGKNNKNIKFSLVLNIHYKNIKFNFNSELLQFFYQFESFLFVRVKLR